MSYQVLARKYRPSTFSEVVGQEHVLKALENSIQHNKLHQAYMFSGTRGVGKTTIARIIGIPCNKRREMYRRILLVLFIISSTLRYVKYSTKILVSYLMNKVPRKPRYLSLV